MMIFGLLERQMALAVQQATDREEDTGDDAAVKVDAYILKIKRSLTR